MTRVLYTSDLHFGHRLVAGHRGYASAEEHDEAICEEWTQAVRSGDVVYVLGDLAVSRPEGALSLLAALPGRKHLISGNHDPVHPMHRNHARWQRPYLEVFESVAPFARRKLGGTDVLLSHFPYARDRGPVRYGQYRLRDEGAWLAHGHTHGTERVLGREIHVGWDAWGRMVDQGEVMAAVAEDVGRVGLEPTT